MGGERDVTLHQRVGELELIRDANEASLYLRLLFPHGNEFGILKFGFMVTLPAITKAEFNVVILPHNDSASCPMVLFVSSRCKIISVRVFHTNYRYASA